MMLALVGLTMAFLIAIALRGVREVERREAEARHAATHDELSGLPNRTALVEALDEATAAGRADRTPVAVVYLDLDGFKEVNDAFGHETGNQLLKEVARGFRERTSGHLLARVGGDEFAVVVSGPGAVKVACDLGWRLISFVSDPFELDGRLVSVGTSVGVAIADAADPSAEEMLRRADVAMYQAKQQGPNRLFVYDAVIDTIRHERLEIADDLRRALREDSLDLVYQPVFSAETHAIVGVEALLRWNRPVSGPLPPSVFVPIAEQSGLIDELGRWTIRRACLDGLAWPSIKISVNVSPAQFRNPNFDALVVDILKETDFPPTRLELEVTESYFIVNPDQARKAIDMVRNLGVAVALDDFGTGYSSIGYLRSFTFDKLKLDRSLITGIATDERVQRLVKATVALAEALDLRVTAEGVETDEEATFLRAAGCAEFQGFFFAKPSSAQAISRPPQGSAGKWWGWRSRRDAGSRRHAEGLHPPETLVGVPPRPVLATDPAGIADCVKSPEYCGVVDNAFVRLRSAWHGGDLHMADAVEITVEEGEDIVAHPADVVDVEHEAEVRRADTIDDRSRLVDAGIEVAGHVVRVESLEEERQPALGRLRAPRGGDW